MLGKLRDLPLSVKIVGGFLLLVALCMVGVAVLMLGLYDDWTYGQSRREQQAVEAMTIYPEADLIYEADFRDDGDYAVQSYFYVTDDSLEDVKAYYVEDGVENLIYDDENLKSLPPIADLDRIVHSGGFGAVSVAHERVCGHQTYSECLSNILIEVDDEAGETLIVISHWITYF